MLERCEHLKIRETLLGMDLVHMTPSGFFTIKTVTKFKSRGSMRVRVPPVADGTVAEMVKLSKLSVDKSKQSIRLIVIRRVM